MLPRQKTQTSNEVLGQLNIQYTPTVSVILPVLNGEKTIAETIDSVLAQSFKNLELIIINSESTDSTGDILERKNLEDNRIRIFDYPKAHASVNRNRGLKHAAGSYISFIDADDLWHRDKILSQYNQLQENPSASLVYSWTHCIDESGKYLRKGRCVNHSGYVLPQLLLSDFIGSGSNPMIRRQDLEAVEGFDELLTSAEDTDLWLRLAQRCEFVVVPHPHVFYRVTGNSESSNIERLEIMALKVFDRVFESAPDSFQYIKKYRLGSFYRYIVCRSLESSPPKKSRLLTAKILIKCVFWSPGTLLYLPMWKAVLKYCIVIFLPDRMSSYILSNLPRLNNTSTLMSYRPTSYPDSLN
jgi:glycosyltransferase involved in cell wall biosynthesis